MSKFYYGGQAVLEGVMMRGRFHMAVAVREEGGGIRVHSEPLQGALYSSPIMKILFVRGIAMLAETLSLGMRSLMWSAKVAATDKVGEEVEFGNGMMWSMLISALLFGTALFFVTPLVITGAVERFIPSALLSNVVEGIIRLAILLGYIWGIGRLPDIRRVFQYHGAEHKTVNAHEAGAPLDVPHVQHHSTEHVRCGTSFLLMLVVVSILVFALLGNPPVELRVLSRIVLIPVIAAIAYELLRFAAAHYNYPIVRFVYRPNLALQRFTTGEPDDDQVAVAIAALQTVIDADAVTLREREQAAELRSAPVPVPQLS